MVEPPFDAYLLTPNRSPRQNVPRRGAVIHHGAILSLAELERLCMGGKQVSATAIAKDRVSKRLMGDGDRPWSMSSAWADSSFRSCETANESASGWTLSDASHWELAHLVAYWATIDGFWPHRDGDPKTWTVLGHREVYTVWGVSYATACPGGADLDLITRRAQALLTAADPAPERPRWKDDLMSVIGLENVRGEPAKGWLSFTATPGKLVAHPYIKNRENTDNAVSSMVLYAAEQESIRLVRDFDFIALLVGLGFADVPRMETPTDNAGAARMREWLPEPGQIIERTPTGTIRY